MAEKKYRPEGWVNPYPDKVIIEHDRQFERLIAQRHGLYEEGADALLEGLRAGALMYRHGDAAQFTNGGQVINFDEGDRGHLVFIKEDGA